MMMALVAMLMGLAMIVIMVTTFIGNDLLCWIGFRFGNRYLW